MFCSVWKNNVSIFLSCEIKKRSIISAYGGVRFGTFPRLLFHENLTTLSREPTRTRKKNTTTATFLLERSREKEMKQQHICITYRWQFLTGGDPNNDLDDTYAISGGVTSDVVFGYGIYAISSPNRQ